MHRICSQISITIQNGIRITYIVLNALECCEKMCKWMMGDKFTLNCVVYLRKIKREQKRLYDVWFMLKNDVLDHQRWPKWKNNWWFYQFALTQRSKFKLVLNLKIFQKCHKALPDVEKPWCLLYSKTNWSKKSCFRSLRRSSSFNGHNTFW